MFSLIFKNNKKEESRSRILRNILIKKMFEIVENVKKFFCAKKHKKWMKIFNCVNILKHSHN